MRDTVTIREARETDLDSILSLMTSAFGREDESVLVRELLEDPTGEPRLSLVAVKSGEIVGHILFTAARIVDSDSNITASILAPLAVCPELQKTGIGSRLMDVGLKRLARAGVDLVFVLGHPSYYPRAGFEPAGRLGLEAPYPIPEEYSDAWMVKALSPGLSGLVRGTVACAAALDTAEAWSE